VIPSPAMSQRKHGAVGDAEFGGKIDLSLAAAPAREGVERLRVCDLGSPAFFTGSHKPKANGMGAVFSTGGQFEVAWPVVGFDAVDVVDLVPRRDGTNERIKDESVREATTLRPVQPELMVEVALQILRSHDLAATPETSPRFVDDLAIHGTDSPGVGDFVRIGSLSDGKPAFFGGKFCVSHREPPTRVPVVRLGWDVDASRRAAFIFAQNEVQV